MDGTLVAIMASKTKYSPFVSRVVSLSVISLPNTRIFLPPPGTTAIGFLVSACIVFSFLGLAFVTEVRSEMWSYFKSSAIVANCSSAACKSAVMSAAMTSGAGRFALSSSASSFSQKMSRFTLSSLVSSS